MDTKRHIALPDDLWTQTKVQAAIEGTGARHIVIRALRKELELGAFEPVTIPLAASEVERRTAPPDAGSYNPTFPGFGASHPAPKPTKKR